MGLNKKIEMWASPTLSKKKKFSMKNLEFREKWSEINPGCTKNDDDGAKCFECNPNQHHILYNTARTRKCAENYTQIEGTSKCIPFTDWSIHQLYIAYNIYNANSMNAL